MMRNKVVLIFFIVSFFTVFTDSFAMLPVVDVGTIANLIKNFNQLKKQYDLLRKTYQNAQQQLEQVKQLTNDAEGHDAEGHYGFGALFNSEQDLKNHAWSPENWQSALQGLAGGNPARYQELVDTYQRDHFFLSTSEYEM